MAGTADPEEQNSNQASNFWDCRAYQRTVKRVDAAYKLCSELCLMIQERSELEKAYSSNLKKWSARWLSFLDSGLEYASGAIPWQGLCREAEAISNVHLNVRNILVDEIQTSVKHWQKEHFHKTPLPPHALKEAKQFEQDFEMAQKPWAKKLKKVHSNKKDYYHACKNERSLQVQVQNAKNDPSGTAEQLKKIQDKLRKTEKDVERTQLSYKHAVSDLNLEEPKYIEEMTKVFNRTQELERERLCFFKEVFTNLQNALNVCARSDYNTIYNELADSISQCDVDSDLNWWSTNHGVDMPAIFPQYEEYSPELVALANKKRSVVTDPNPQVTLVGITTVLNSTTEGTNPKSKSSANGPHLETKNPFDQPLTSSPPQLRKTHPTEPNVAPEDSVGQSELADPDMYNSATYDDGREGIQVRALYDYTRQEDDEISLKAGELFVKLEEADEQGWCKGRKNGRAGLYPANYAEEFVLTE